MHFTDGVFLLKFDSCSLLFFLFLFFFSSPSLPLFLGSWNQLAYNALADKHGICWALSLHPTMATTPLKIYSYNIHGFNSSLHRSKVFYHLKSQQVDVVCLQETRFALWSALRYLSPHYPTFTRPQLLRSIDESSSPFGIFSSSLAPEKLPDPLEGTYFCTLPFGIMKSPLSLTMPPMGCNTDSFLTCATWSCNIKKDLLSSCGL